MNNDKFAETCKDITRLKELDDQQPAGAKPVLPNFAFNLGRYYLAKEVPGDEHYNSIVHRASGITRRLPFQMSIKTDLCMGTEPTAGIMNNSDSRTARLMVGTNQIPLYPIFSDFVESMEERIESTCSPTEFQVMETISCHEDFCLRRHCRARRKEVMESDKDPSSEKRGQGSLGSSLQIMMLPSLSNSPKKAGTMESQLTSTNLTRCSKRQTMHHLKLLAMSMASMEAIGPFMPREAPISCWARLSPKGDHLQPHHQHSPLTMRLITAGLMEMSPKKMLVEMIPTKVMGRST